MKLIDDKHHLEGETIVKTGNGVPIDLEKEPVILFRGRDKLALPMLEFYRELCIKDIKDGCTDYQLATMDNRIRLFKEFADTSETMKQPGVTRGL
jgi:hypothetical protein